MNFLSTVEPSREFVTEAVEVLNPYGKFPVLLICDHASTSLPDNVDGLGLDPKYLSDHMGVDIGVAPILRALSDLLDAPAILTRNSRLLIDCNRWIADPTSIPEQSDGIFVPGNQKLDIHMRAERWHRYFWPYHRTLHKMKSRMMAAHRAPIFFALHSCTRNMAGECREVDAGTFWHYDRRLSDYVLAGLRTEPSLMVAENYPYSGVGGTSFTLDYHSWGHDLLACGFEIVNDLISTPPEQAQWAARLARVLHDISMSQMGKSR